jgi:penicillin-binding protein 2
MPVAGKTGTAQVRKDGEPTTLAWFVGYAPVKNPRVAVAVLVEGVPAENTTYGGGSTAAPIAKAVFSGYLGL